MSVFFSLSIRLSIVMRQLKTRPEPITVEKPADALKLPMLWSAKQKKTAQAGILVIAAIPLFLILVLFLIVPFIFAGSENLIDFEIRALPQSGAIPSFLAIFNLVIMGSLLYGMFKVFRSGPSESRLVNGYWIENSKSLVEVWRLDELGAASITSDGGNSISLTFSNDVGIRLPLVYENPNVEKLLHALVTTGLPFEIDENAVALGTAVSAPILWKCRRGFSAVATSSAMIALAIAIPSSIFIYIFWMIWTPLPDKFADLLFVVMKSLGACALGGLSLILALHDMRGRFIDVIVDIMGTMAVSEEAIQFRWPVSGKVRRVIALRHIVDAYLVEGDAHRGWIALTLKVPALSDDHITINLFGVPDYVSALHAIRKCARL